MSEELKCVRRKWVKRNWAMSKWKGVNRGSKSVMRKWARRDKGEGDKGRKISIAETDDPQTPLHVPQTALYTSNTSLHPKTRLYYPTPPFHPFRPPSHHLRLPNTPTTPIYAPNTPFIGMFGIPIYRKYRYWDSYRYIGMTFLVILIYRNFRYTQKLRYIGIAEIHRYYRNLSILSKFIGVILTIAYCRWHLSVLRW